MHFCHFIVFQATDDAARLSAEDHALLRERLTGIPEMRSWLLHEPARASDPYLNDGDSPKLALQLYFDTLPALEAAVSLSSGLQDLARPGVFRSLDGAPATQQAMLVRAFPVPQPRPQAKLTDPRCTYLVAYEGSADDPPAWLAHYIHHHPPIMARFPGIREIEIYSRVDWCGGLALPRVDFLQRNKVVFDSQEALTAALHSPVRHEMRADFAQFPRFTGRNTHYPMLTHRMA